MPRVLWPTRALLVGVSRSLFFAGYADAGPRNGLEPRLGNHLTAVAADAVCAHIEAHEGVFDCLKNLRLGLLDCELDVDLIVATGLIRHVAFARVVLHHCLYSGPSPEYIDLCAFPKKCVLEVIHVLYRRCHRHPCPPM